MPPLMMRATSSKKVSTKERKVLSAARLPASLPFYVKRLRLTEGKANAR